MNQDFSITRVWLARPVAAVASRSGVFLVVWMVLAAGSAVLAQPMGPWGSDAATLLRMIRGDDAQRAAELASAQLRSERDPVVRRELRAVLAITLLYSPDRPSQTDGRTLLVELIREFPPLAARGECRQALGVASLALRETSAALEHFAAAADDFEMRGAAPEFADALGGLAQAWAAHAEWEMTPRRFGVTAPAGPDQIRAIRDHQFEELVRRAARLPLSGAADRVRLAQARRWLQEDDGATSAVKLLEQLCPAGRRDRVAGEAALTLADVYEQADDAEALKRVLTLAVACEDAGVASFARDRLGALRRPRVEVLSSLEAVPGQAPPLQLRARNVTQLRAELRRIDLGDWLQEKQGRFLPAQLATSGSVLWAHTWEVSSAADDGTWWCGPAADAPRLPGDVGLYVLELRCESTEGAPLVQRHLVTISGLRAVAFIGDSRVVVWSEPCDGGASPSRIAGRFWMYGSFQPTRFELRDGHSVFRLPAEARLLRDRRWSMLLESDLGPLFLTDALPLADLDADSVGTYILTAATAEIRDTRRFTVTGALLEEPAPASKLAGREEYKLVLIDTAGSEVANAPLQVSPSGVFFANIALSDSSIARHLAVVLRRGLRSLTNVAGRYTLPVSMDEGSDAQLHIALRNPDERGQHDEIHVRFFGKLPWNVALKDAMVFWGGRLVALPTADAPAWGAVYPSGERNRMDAQGMAEGHAPRFSDRPFEKPILFGVWATLRGWDGRRVTSAAQFLLGPQRRHAWLTTDPPVTVVDQPLSIAAGWIDAEIGVIDAWPSVRISRDGKPCAELQLHAGPRGLCTPAWTPSVAGKYTADLVWPDYAGVQNPPTAQLVFRVDASARTAASAPAACTAILRLIEGNVVCELRADAQPEGARVAALLIGERDPLGVVGLNPQTSAASVPVGDETPRRVIFFRWVDGRVARAGEARVESRLGGTLKLEIELSQRRVLPGAAARVVAQVRGEQTSEPVTLVARLVPASSDSAVQWADGDWRSDEILDAAIAVSAAPVAGLREESPAGGWITVERSRSAAELFFSDGQTLWTATAVARDGRAEFDVPIPRTPGGYRILVYATSRNTAGVVAQDFIAARDGHVLRAFLPERYCLGDRVQVVLEAIAADPRRATDNESFGVTADGGGLLVFDVSAAAPDLQRDAEGRLRWNVSSAGAATAVVVVEAAAIGEGVLRIECPGGAAAPLEVPIRVQEPAAAVVADRSIRVKRSFVRMIAYEEEEIPEMDPRAEGRLFGHQWQRIPMDPAKEHVVPGQILLIREEVENPTAISDLTWRQTTAANTVAVLDRPAHMPEIAPIRVRRPDRVEFSGSLLPGRTTHEYFIVATRGGSCVLPSPEVFAGDRPVNVDMAGGETRLTVISSP